MRVTSTCPPSAARWSGVESLVRLRHVVTTWRSNFISCSRTATDPCWAAMCAHVFPSLNHYLLNIHLMEYRNKKNRTLLAVETRDGCCLRNSLTTLEWLCCAAMWMAFWPSSSMASGSAPSSRRRLHTSSWPDPAASCRAVSFFWSNHNRLIWFLE